MKVVLSVLLSLSVAACSTADVHTSTTRTSERSVTVMPGAYAMQTATAVTFAPNEQRLTLSDCARNFDDTISYLEHLMQQKQLQQQQAQSAL
ncbi:MAG TPA: hypothetical protein VFS88_00675 [Micavibrio sp.]|nr:hypothetical protein [Micavibrio sp.]